MSAYTDELYKRAGMSLMPTADEHAQIMAKLNADPQSQAQIDYPEMLRQMRTEQINSDLHLRARTLRMTPYDMAMAEWQGMTDDKNSPFYGQDPQTFAQSVKALGSNRYDLLDAGKIQRGLMSLGNIADREFTATGIAQSAGRGMENLTMAFSDDPNLWAAARSMGEEMPASIANLLPLALGTVMSGGALGAPSIAAMGLTGADAFTDSREAGRTTGSSTGAAALAALTVGIMPGTGRFFEGFAANQALKIAGTNASAAAASLRSGLLNSAAKFAVRETGQMLAGSVVDVADVALFDEQRTLADLTKSEYLVPMLLSNAVMVMGHEAISLPSQALRSRLSKESALRPAVENYLENKKRLIIERRNMENMERTATRLGTMSDIKAHEAYEQLYDDMYRAHFYSNNDMHTAAAHNTISTFDANKLLPWTLAPDQKPGDFLVKMANAAKELDMPLSRLAKIPQSMFNAISHGTPLIMSDASIALRALNVIENQTQKLYRDIPDELRTNPDASAIYQVHKKQIQQGTANLIFADKASQITAVALNHFAGSGMPQIALYKGRSRLVGEALETAMATHGDAIKASLAQHNDVVRNLYNTALQQGGTRLAPNVDPATGKMVQELMKGLGVKTPVVLLTDADLKLPEFATLRAHFNRPELYGMMIALGDGVNEVNVVWNRGGQGREGMNSLMHELGHVYERDVARQFPQAIEALRKIANDKFAALDLDKLENLRAQSSNHLDFIKRWHKAKGLKFDHSEWFSNQFSKWALQPDAKPTNVVERYAKTVVDGLRKMWNSVKSLSPGFKPQVEFKQWMDHMSRKFYTNLMWDQDTAFRSLAETYQMGDHATDMLGRHLYENSSPDFEGLISKRLAEWHMQGRKQDPQQVIAGAAADYKTMKNMADSMPNEPELATATQVSMMMFDPARLGVSQDFINKVVDKFHNMNRSGEYVDEYQAGNVVRTITQRWAMGELADQKGTPKKGGEEALWKRINHELDRLTKPVPEPMTLKANGDVDSGGGPLRKFKDLAEARAVADGMMELAKYEQYQVEVQTVRGEHKIVFKYAADARKVEFDERWVNSEMDDTVSGTIDQHTWSLEQLAMDAPPADVSVPFHKNHLLSDVTRQGGETPALRFKTPVGLSDGARISGFTDSSKTVLYGYDKNGKEFTVRPSQLESNGVRIKEVGETAVSLKSALDSLKPRINTFDMAFKEFNPMVPPEVAVELGNAGMYSPMRATQELGAAVMRAIGAKVAPEPLLRALESVQLEATKGKEFFDDMRAVGKDIGYEGDTIDGFVAHVLNKLTSGADLKELAMLAPRPLDGLLRELGAVVDEYGSVSEFGARLGSLKGLHEQSLEQLKNARGAGLELLTADRATDRLTEILQISTEGGAAARMDRMSRTAGWARQLYEATINGFAHMAARNPVLRPFHEATSMEGRDQFRMMNDTAVAIHADDPHNPTAVDKPGKAFTAIRKDPAFNKTFDNMVRLQQVKRDSFNNLLNAKDEHAMKLFETLSPEQKAISMEMIERMHITQNNNVQLRATETRQLDRINLATYLARQMKTMAPEQAHAFVETMYNARPDQLPEVMARSGLDPELSKRLLAYKESLDTSTTAAISKLQSAPWYVSEQRMERFLVRFYDESVKRTGATSFKTYEEAQQWVAAQEKHIKIGKNDIEDQEKTYGRKMTNDFRDVLDNTIKAKQEVIAGMFGDDAELAKSVSTVLDDLFQSVDATHIANTKGTLSLNRKHSEGRETLDMLDQQRESLRRSTIGLTRARTQGIYNLYGQDKFFSTPEGSRMHKLAQQHLKNVREPDTEVGMAVNKFAFLWTLGTNASSMITEVATLPLVMAPLAREKGAGFVESFALPKKVLAQLTKGWIDGKHADPDHQWILDRAKRENVLTARHVMDIDASRVTADLDTNRIINGNLATRALGNTAEALYKIGAKMYQPAATVSASTSLVVGYELAKKYNPKGTKEQWYSEAINFHEISQGAGSKSSRPVGFFSTSGAGRTLSQVAYNLQGFANAQVANLVRQGSKGYMGDPQWTPAQRKSARAAFNQSLAITIGTVGLAGIPLAKALSLVVEKALGYNPEKELEKWIYDNAGDDETTKSFITNLAMRGGLYAAGLPFDMQSRISVGGLFALNNYDGFNVNNVAGVGGSFAQQTLEAMGGALQGRGLTEAVDMVPAGLRRAVQLWVDDGKIVRNGRVMLEPSAIESASMMLGFTPLRMRKEYDKQSAKEYFIKREDTKRANVTRNATTMLQMGQNQEAQLYIAKQAEQLMGMRSYNDSKKLLQENVATSYAKLNTPTASDPGMSGEAPMLESIYGGGNQTSQMQQYLKEMEAKVLLGAPARLSRQRLNQSRVVDRLMASDPGMSPYLAKTYARLYDRNALPNPLAGLGGNIGLPIDLQPY